MALNRRQFAAGMLTLPVIARFSCHAAAARVTSNLPEPVRLCIGHLTDAYARYLGLDAAYDKTDESAFDPLPWRMAYEEMLDAHACLTMAIDGGDPAQRDVMAWAHTLAPPFCERVQAFWTPIDDLSPPFVEIHKRAYGARKRYADANGIFVAELQERTLSLSAAKLADDVRLAAFGQWLAARDDAFEMRAGTAGDRQFLRRMVETGYAGDAIDTPYLQSMGVNTRYGFDLEHVPCCPPPCASCRRLFESVADVRTA